jgi:hypothetical protein
VVLAASRTLEEVDTKDHLRWAPLLGLHARATYHLSPALSFYGMFDLTDWTWSYAITGASLAYRYHIRQRLQNLSKTFWCSAGSSGASESIN